MPKMGIIMLKQASSLFMKLAVMVMIGLLVLSFALLDLGGVVSNSGEPPAVTVAGEKIPQRVVNQLAANEAFRLQQMLGTAPDAQLQELIGIRVREQLVNQKLVDIGFEELGLELSEAYLAKKVVSNPEFQEKDAETGLASFSPVLFQQRLRGMGMTEADYFDSLAREAVIGEFIAALGEMPPFGEGAYRLFNAERNEARAAQIISIDADFKLSDKTPTEAELIDYYQQHRQEFDLPEMRSAVALLIDKTALADELVPSDEILKHEFERQKEALSVPEMRSLTRFLAADEAQAQAIKKALEAGEATADIAKKYAIDVSSLDYGTTSRGDLLATGMVDQAWVDALFDLPENAVAQPVETTFGWQVFVPVKKMARVEAKFADVKEQLAKDWAANQLNELLYQLTVQVEDAVAAGQALEEIAEAYHLTLKAVQDVTAESELPVALQEIDGIQQELFALPEGGASMLLSSADGTSYAVLRVDAVQPSRSRALDEVKGQVAKRWKEASRQQRRREKITELRDALAAEKTSPATVLMRAKAMNANAYPMPPVKRVAMDQSELPAAMLKELFGLKSHQLTKVHALADGAFGFAQLVDITPAAMEEIDEVKTEFTSAWQEEVLGMYLAYLRQQYPVKYHGAARSF